MTFWVILGGEKFWGKEAYFSAPLCKCTLPTLHTFYIIKIWSRLWYLPTHHHPAHHCPEAKHTHESMLPTMKRRKLGTHSTCFSLAEWCYCYYYYHYTIVLLKSCSDKFLQYWNVQSSSKTHLHIMYTLPPNIYPTPIKVKHCKNLIDSYSYGRGKGRPTYL